MALQSFAGSLGQLNISGSWMLHKTCCGLQSQLNEISYNKEAHFTSPAAKAILCEKIFT